jgi:hypothetical protein
MAPQYPRSPGRTRPQTISMARSTRRSLSWGEVLRETLRELGGVGQEVDQLQLEIAEFRTALAKLRGWVGEQRQWDLAVQ